MHEVARDPVVIVEDDSSMSVALDRILRLGGYRSRAFASAEAFLASDAASEAACLVLDVRLDRMTGFSCTSSCAATSPARPVIFMSGLDDASSRRRAAAAGAVVFLAKPFSGRSLLDAVRHALAEPHVGANPPLAP
jgi:FixJ family two-component response regulator